MRVPFSSCIGGLAVCILVASPLARADDCAMVKAASIAQIKVPHAVVHVMTLPGKPPQRFEMIFKGDKVYTLMNGAWSSMAFSVQDQIDTINAASEQAAKATYTCRKVGSESVNGESASVLASHGDAHGKVTDSRLWLSDKTGLPLKSEVRLATGTVVTDEFRYTNVDVPPGVK